MEKICLEYSVELILTCAEPVIHWLFSIFNTWWRQILLTTAISSGRNKCIVYFGPQHWLCMCKYAKYITHDTSSSSLAYVCFIVFPLEVYLPPECTELTTHMKFSSFFGFFCIHIILTTHMIQLIIHNFQILTMQVLNIQVS